MDDEGPGAPAGWYPDPLGSAGLRWWDARGWTEFTAERRAPEPERVAGDDILMTPSPDTGELAVEAPRVAASAAAGLAIGSLPSAVPRPARTATIAAWALALLWPIQLAAATVVVLVLGEGRNPPLLWAVWAVPWLGAVAIAALDRHVLRRRGIRRPANAWWALLTPGAYLLARLLATGRGAAPLVAWGLSAAAVAAAVVAIPAALIATAPQPFADDAAASVERTADSLDADLDVTCPSREVPLRVGESFACDAVAEDGDRDRVVVALVRQNVWIDWQVQDWGSAVTG